MHRCESWMTVAGNPFSRMAGIVRCTNIVYWYPSIPRQFRLYRAWTSEPMIGQTSCIIDLEQADSDTDNTDSS